MRKAERLLHILALLRRKNNLGAMDLAKRCGVSKRTILRDISSISSANIPIFYDNGYRLVHEQFLPPISFTSAESRLLTRILKSRHRRNADGDGLALRSILDKLETCLVLKSRSGRERAGLESAGVRWGKE